LKTIRNSLAALLVLLAGYAHSATIAVTTTPDPIRVSGVGDFVLGYSFIVNSPIAAVSLGVYDHGADGLNGPHDVGLWNSAGVLLASTTVGAGSGAALDESYRFSAIAPLDLLAGQTYYVGATKVASDSDPWLFDPLKVAAAPEITYESPRFQFYTGKLVFPDLVGSATTGYFGGNLQFASRAVAEPSVLALVGFGLTGLALFRRRRH
jgi:hypothetical protein